MNELRKSFLVSLWFMFLTFPIMVIRVNTVEKIVVWRWENMAMIGIGSFVLSFVWRWAIRRKEASDAVAASGQKKTGRMAELAENPSLTNSLKALFLVGFLVTPWLVTTYQTNILISFLLYVVLGLGLNVIVGVAGLLFLGHAAFYAIGAYSYALLNQYFGLGFWFALPLGGVFAALAGIALAFPVLRLRGDYLAIVTLGFGEIVRLLLENLSDITGGPSGISNIPRPGFFDIKLSVADANIYIYYIVLALAIITIIAVSRLKDSRIGRALQALREDEVACEAMGIDRVGVKVMAFGLGTAWAGFAGVIFAAKTTFINPASFTFFESAIILSIVVLGGMGSNLGVILGSAFLVLLPEYLRAFSEYRMIMFATAMVLMMVFRPQGLIPAKGRTYTVDDPDLVTADGGANK
ncbi:MAG: branched-chain amino acid ABC transporter permease [Desulfomicrobium sp.]|nr:branched-chain amino acid ABC transporter permease [Pseudomonadota bacterium]MBV1711265.1 branched-chain amino acid ABC transporter permease [Desulfomicrobium sp.]MBU4569936.1 branched-chain amino acid ABC transporter permease [Pseudomonadota bacterium]MBU4595035.1 branched-chain amino acid ABC transporter permease [Pseudomonadota bacterium]MBV1720134.1 branched-chain amino acid ABC transporter permease [Desulfomicrobium sp.]